MTDAYARAGVNIDAGNKTVERAIARLRPDWRHPDQLGELGGFSGLFRLPGDGSRALVASADGVGTKILIAAAHGPLRRRRTRSGESLRERHPRRLGATPLFFLDYLAVGQVGAGDGGRRGARRARALAGPTTWRCSAARRRRCRASIKPGDFDLAGTIVGLVDIAAIPNKGRRYRRRRDHRFAVRRFAHERLHASPRADRARRVRAAVRRCDAYGDALLAAASKRTAAKCARSKRRRRQSDGAHHRRRLDRQRAAHVARQRARRCSNSRAGPFRRSWPSSCGAATWAHEERYRTSSTWASATR